MSNTKDQQEPSMEDILASIRRILSEDEVEEAPAKPAAAVAPAPSPAAPPAENAPEPEDEDVLELDESMVMVETSPSVAAAAEGASELDGGSHFAAEADFDAMLEPEPTKEVRPMFAPAPMQAEPELDPEPEGLLAPSVAEASTAALSELARAVARERGVGLGTRGITLEDMVRDIMRPILKDWLDQNLPFMVERIVRKEIERMVNRAEKP